NLEGKSSHGALPYLGKNAIVHMLHFVGLYYEDEFARKSYMMLHDWMGQPLNLCVEDEQMGYMSLNVGIIEVGNKQRIGIDIRYPLIHTSDHIIQHFHNKMKSLSFNGKIIVRSCLKPLLYDNQSSLVKEINHIYQNYTGDLFSSIQTISGLTYAHQFDHVINFGPEFPNREKTDKMYIGYCHEKDEGMSLNEFILSSAMYTRAIEVLGSEQFELDI
ncbi:MAG: peptidase dimerization domain-containing protein, partial [Faecalibacillus sp.]